ncbi:MAG: hypothetical protein WBX25_20840 [Rhodomicrobium sp.]
MTEIEAGQNRDGTWGLWIGRTCIRTDFITVDAARKWAEQQTSGKAEPQKQKAGTAKQ